MNGGVMGFHKLFQKLGHSKKKKLQTLLLFNIKDQGLKQLDKFLCRLTKELKCKQDNLSGSKRIGPLDISSLAR